MPGGVRPVRWPALVTLAIIGGWVLTLGLYSFSGDWSRFLGIGKFFHDQLPVGLVSEPVHVHDGMGFDGQFFFYQANDPFLTHGAQAGFDLAMVRGRRVLFPLLAWLTSRPLGGDRAIPGVMIVINLLAAAGLLWALRSMACLSRSGPEATLSSESTEVRRLAATWIPPLLLLTSFVLVPIYKTTSEILCMALIAASALAHQRGLRVGTGLFCALAILTKETAVIWALALLGDGLLRRSPRDTLVPVLAALPLGLWVLVLKIRLGVTGVAIGAIDPSLVLNLEPPFKGLIDQCLVIAHEGINRRTAFSLVMMFSLLSITGYGLATLRRQRPDALTLFFLGSVVLMLVLDQRCWDYIIDIGRQPFTLPLAAALLALAEPRRGRVLGWIVVLGLMGLWGVVFVLGKIALGLA